MPKTTPNTSSRAVCVAKASEAVTVASADELPTTIEAGATVKLAANISFSSGRQIELVTGTLDGQGRSVELSGKALDKNVIGVVQNLGVAGQATMDDCEGALASFARVPCKCAGRRPILPMADGSAVTLLDSTLFSR